ncbi:MAG: hypothetical protein ABUS54_00130 [Actinomycetota bacterium]
MRIGDVVIWNGRRVMLLGIEPMSVPERSATVRDVGSGEELQVPYDELEEGEGLAPEA